LSAAAEAAAQKSQSPTAARSLARRASGGAEFAVFSTQRRPRSRVRGSRTPRAAHAAAGLALRRRHAGQQQHQRDMRSRRAVHRHNVSGVVHKRTRRSRHREASWSGKASERPRALSVRARMRLGASARVARSRQHGSSRVASHVLTWRSGTAKLRNCGATPRSEVHLGCIVVCLLQGACAAAQPLCARQLLFAIASKSSSWANTAASSAAASSLLVTPPWSPRPRAA